MRAFVTGGTGFVGSHLVEALLGRGFEVRCLVRDPADLKWLTGLDVELVVGDCSDPEGLKGSTAGADYVFHVAGLTKAVDPRDYYTVNSDGARNMAEAALRDNNGLKKFVLVSSQAAAGPSQAGVPRKEDDPPSPVTDYGKSKLLAEKYLTGLKDELPVAIVRPPSVYGPRDRDIYTFFKLVSRGVRTSFNDERLISFCYVKDLAEGIIAAALKDTDSGEAFFIAHDRPLGWDEIGEAVAAALGVRARRVALPIAALSLVALVSEGVSALTGRPALMNRQKMAEIRQRYWVVDTAKAKAVLGFEAAVDFRAGAMLTARWYREHGWL